MAKERGGATSYTTTAHHLSHLYQSTRRTAIISTKCVFGTVRNEAYRRYMPPVLPVPDTSVSSVRLQYRYDINTGTGNFGKFGTTSIAVLAVPVQTFVPVPEKSVSSVRRQYRYPTFRQVRYDINTGTGNFGKFGRTSIPVPAVPVSTYAPSWCRYWYNTATGTGHLGKIGTTATRYRTFRFVWHDINPIPPHCDVIPWSFGSRQHPRPHTPWSPSIFQYVRYAETLSTHEQRRKIPEGGGLQQWCHRLWWRVICKVCQLPHTPAPAAEVIDKDGEKNAVSVISPAPVYNSLTGDVHELPAEIIKAVDGFPGPAGFWGGRDA